MTTTNTASNGARTRTESDSMGQIDVPADKYYGAQSARSLVHFEIGDGTTPRDVMPTEVIKAMARSRRRGPVNKDLGKARRGEDGLDRPRRRRGHHGELQPHFPLRVWQTGSGTQTNMNVNGSDLRTARSSFQAPDGIEEADPSERFTSTCRNRRTDTFPTAMQHGAAESMNAMLPAVAKLRDALRRPKRNSGRTSSRSDVDALQDATPLTLGQEFSGYVTQLDRAMIACREALDHLYDLAIVRDMLPTCGGTAPPLTCSIPHEMWIQPTASGRSQPRAQDGTATWSERGLQLINVSGYILVPWLDVSRNACPLCAQGREFRGHPCDPESG